MSFVSIFLNRNPSGRSRRTGCLLTALVLGSALACLDLVAEPSAGSFHSAYFENGGVFAMAEQADGKLLVSGTFNTVDGNAVSGMVRLKVDGTVDPTFAFADYQNGYIRAILPLPDGNILVGGTFLVRTGSVNPNGLVRLTSTGAIDATFARRSDFNGEIWSLARDSSDRILVAGAFNVFSGRKANLVRLQPSGAVDSTFNPNVNDSQFQSINGVVQKVVLLPDRRILIVGNFTVVRGIPRAGVAVLFADGGVDPAFDFTGDHDCCLVDALLTEEGGMFLAGQFTTFNGLRRSGIVRLSQDGQLDLSVKGLSSAFPQVKGLVSADDGRLFLSGVFRSPSGTNWSTGVQLFADGEVDTSFQSSTTRDSGEVLVRSASGAIYQAMAGTGASGNYGFWIVRHAPASRTPFAPRLLTNPESQRVLEGNSVLLAVEHTAEPRPSYQWLFNKTPLTGATNRVLQLANVRHSADGEYQLQIANDLGNLTTPILRLQVDGVAAGPGHVDLDFDPGAGISGGPTSLLELPDGKILVTGSFGYVQGLPRPRVVRLLADGTVDPDFVPEGMEYFSINFAGLSVSNTVVLAGPLNPTVSGQRWKVVRLLPNGNVDPGFKPFVTGYNLGFGTMFPNADGFVYIAGSPDAKFSGIFRLKPDGTLDPTYRLQIDGLPSQMVGQPDGKILLLGWFNMIQNQDRNRLARLNADGNLDLSFIPEAIYTDTVPEHLALMPDGKIIVSDNFWGGGGFRGRGIFSPPESRLVRFNENGSVDRSFQPEINTEHQIAAVATQPSGTILLATFPFAYSDTPPAFLVRLFPDGSVDHGFDPDSNALQTTTVIPLSENYLLLGGNFTQVSGVNRNGLARVDAHASTPTTPSIVRSPSGNVLPTGATLRLNASVHASPQARYQWQRDGVDLPGETNRLLSLKNIGGSAAGDYRIIATNPLGSTASEPARVQVTPPETTPGAVDITFYGGDGPNGAVNQLVELPDGKLLIAGNFNAVDGRTRPRIARLNADGTLDESFAPAQGPNNEITSMVVLEDGQIVIGGPFDTVAGEGRSFVATLRPDGTVNRTNTISADTRVMQLILASDHQIIGCGDGFVRGWNQNGTPSRNFGSFNFDGVALAVAVQTDGKVVFAGNFTTDGVARPNIARLLPTGQLDSTFNPGLGANDRIDDLVIQPDGKILIAGAFTSFNRTDQGRLARLNPDGSLDPSFHVPRGADLGRIVPVGHFGLRDVTAVHALGLQSDGHIVIGGEFTTYDGFPVANFARLYPDGALDQNFDIRAGFGPPASRQGAWFSEYNPFSTRWITRVHPTQNNRVFVLGNFPGMDRVDRPRVIKLVSGDIAPSAPLVKSSGQTLQARSGTNVQLFAKVLATPRPTYQWLRDDVPIPGATGPALFLVNVDRSSQGEYRCIISNSLGTVEFVAGQLSILPPRMEAGALDTRYIADLNPSAQTSNVSFDSDGKMIIMGTLPRWNAAPLPLLSRRHPDGTLDLLWDTRTLNIQGVGLNRSISLADGGILVSGSLDVLLTNGETKNTMWLKIGPDGLLSTNFNLLPNIYNATAMTKLADGKIMVGCDSSTGFRLVRLLPDGTLDKSFPSDVFCDSSVYHIAEDAQGRLWIGGEFTKVAKIVRNRIARLTPDGKLDTSFDFGAGPDGAVNFIAPRPDGSIIIGGWFGTIHGLPKPRLARIDSQGVLDESFPVANSVLSASDIQSTAVAPDGRILLAGYIANPPDFSTSSFGVLRLNQDGSEDESFNTGAGFNTAQTLGRFGGPSTALYVTPLGKLMVIGPFSAVDGLPRLSIARLLLEPFPRLFLQSASQGWSFFWDNGVLEGATAVTGPWTVVPGAKSPWSLQIPDAGKFFRLRLDP